ncbi:MAG: DUF3276 family protein [Tepidisphaeraceae bacterium]
MPVTVTRPAPAVQAAPPKDKPEPRVLFQQFFKSVGPRTYAAQVKEASNGNHFLVLTEGKRDEKTDEIRKTRLFVFSEDFAEFLKLVNAAGAFIRDNPVPAEVRKRREKYWAANRQAREKGAPRG